MPIINKNKWTSIINILKVKNRYEINIYINKLF